MTCLGCREEVDALDENALCRDCAFVAKVRSLAIIPVPWGLREVRRRYGVSGETDRRSEETKHRRGTYDA